MVVKKKASILIVDDNEELVDSLGQQYDYLGFNVIKATSPLRALELTALIKPDLMIADIRMPGLDGINLIRKFKQAQPNIKVILMTGYYLNYEQVIKDALKEKLADHVIQKGFKAMELEKMVYELLKSSDEKAPVKGKLLFVDDEREVVDFLKHHFEEEQYEVEVAEDGEQAFEICKKFNPDVVVTDVKMPKRDGIWLIKELQDQKLKPRIIVMTGQDNEPDLQRLRLETGIVEYFSKPFGIDDLDDLLHRIEDPKSEEDTKGNS